jgi:hypothetical protein
VEDLEGPAAVIIRIHVLRTSIFASYTQRSISEAVAPSVHLRLIITKPTRMTEKVQSSKKLCLDFRYVSNTAKSDY